MKLPEISLIGCGRIGFLLEKDPLRNKPCTHFGGAVSAGLKITSASDINSERLLEFGRTAGIDRDSLFTNYRILLKEKKPDIAIISVWTSSHAEIALNAINSGAKIIVIEKPAAASLKDVETLSRSADKNNCRIIVNHERRFDGRYNSVKDLITRGIIGNIRTVNARMLTGSYRGKSDIRDGGGPLLHDGTHLVDIIRYFFGEIRSVQGEFARYGRDSGFEDTASAWLLSENGINIFLEAGGGRKYFQFELEIWGDEGKIVIGNGYNRLYKKKKSALYRGFNDLAEVRFPAIKNRNCFTELYRHTSRMLKRNDIEDVSGISDGYRALEIIHAIYYSSYQGRKKIVLPVKPGLINLNKIFSL